MAAMTAAGEDMGAPVVPVMRYRDLPAAIDWLCTAFGFERHRVTTDRNGAILFAQLTFGNAMVMLGPVRQSAFDRFLKQPDQVGGAETQVCYFFVPDAHAHCSRARSAGAEIVFDVVDRVNGGRSYTCRDPEGHLWNFGTYNPWRPRSGAPAPPRRAHPKRAARGAAMALAGVLVGAAACLAGVRALPQAARSGLLLPQPPSGEPALEAELAREREARRAAERAAGEARRRLSEARAEAQASARGADAARAELAQAKSAAQAAVRDAAELRRHLAAARSEKEAAEQAAKAARSDLARAWARASAAERAAAQVRRSLARERNARAGLGAEASRPPPWE